MDDWRKKLDPRGPKAKKQPAGEAEPVAAQDPPDEATTPPAEPEVEWVDGDGDDEGYLVGTLPSSALRVRVDGRKWWILDGPDVVRKGRVREHMIARASKKAEFRMGEYEVTLHVAGTQLKRAATS